MAGGGGANSGVGGGGADASIGPRALETLRTPLPLTLSISTTVIGLGRVVPTKFRVKVTQTLSQPPENARQGLQYEDYVRQIFLIEIV